ncbi:MAG: hypothetical protein WA624_04325 [Methylocella sp.]
MNCIAADEIRPEVNHGRAIGLSALDIRRGARSMLAKIDESGRSRQATAGLRRLIALGQALRTFELARRDGDIGIWFMAPSRARLASPFPKWEEPRLATANSLKVMMISETPLPDTDTRALRELPPRALRRPP